MPDTPVSLAEHHALAIFLYREAALLDGRAYRDWLGLLADDMLYQVTVQQVRDAVVGPKDIAIIEEDYAGLKSRLDQISNPRLTHAENPPSLTRRFITNVDAVPGAAAETFLVRSNILLHRSRPEDDAGRSYAGQRHDIIRRIDGQLRLAQRIVRLDHQLIHGGSITVLF